MNKIDIIKQLFKFLIRQKKYWLIPLVIFLVVLGFLIVLGEGSVLAPLIYSLF